MLNQTRQQYQQVPLSFKLEIGTAHLYFSYRLASGGCAWLSCPGRMTGSLSDEPCTASVPSRSRS
jgi:hypothetical protein